MEATIFINKLRTRVLPNLKYLGQSKFKYCYICQKRSLFISLSDGEERKLCLYCRSNLRYQMIASYLTKNSTKNNKDFKNKIIWEVSPESPLSRLLSRNSCAQYINSFYSEEFSPGYINENGLRCEDITATSFEDNSIDIIISSDVLEHVDDIDAAFDETLRILKPGGVHLFTVPNCPKTVRRATVTDGAIEHFEQPEYHSDPLNPQEGILAFWHFGEDAVDLFARPGLSVDIVEGPCGKDKRILWRALKAV